MSGTAQKRKYLFTLPREGALYMAGLYDRRGSEECYCILTTAPNASLRPSTTGAPDPDRGAAAKMAGRRQCRD